MHSIIIEFKSFAPCAADSAVFHLYNSAKVSCEYRKLLPMYMCGFSYRRRRPPQRRRSAPPPRPSPSRAFFASVVICHLHSQFRNILLLLLNSIELFLKGHNWSSRKKTTKTIDVKFNIVILVIYLSKNLAFFKVHAGSINQNILSIDHYLYALQYLGPPSD